MALSKAWICLSFFDSVQSVVSHRLGASRTAELTRSETFAKTFGHHILSEAERQAFTSDDSTDRGVGSGMFIHKNLGSALFLRLHHPERISRAVASPILHLVEELLKLDLPRIIGSTGDDETRARYGKVVCFTIGTRHWRASHYVLGISKWTEFREAFWDTGQKPLHHSLVAAVAIGSLPAVKHFIGLGVQTTPILHRRRASSAKTTSISSATA
jgi:hypothetical protein